jgi:hypothetical protein
MCNLRKCRVSPRRLNTRTRVYIIILYYSDARPWRWNGVQTVRVYFILLSFPAFRREFVFRAHKYYKYGPIPIIPFIILGVCVCVCVCVCVWIRIRSCGMSRGYKKINMYIITVRPRLATS